MATRTLESPPSILPLYVRAAAPMIPGASLIPGIPGGGGEIPELELELNGVSAEPGEVAAYAKVCGFALRDHLPPTYPHILAFPLQMAVMADGSFPFGAVGLVHIENAITQHRRIGLDEELRLTVRPTGLEPHPSGRTFSLVTEAWVGRQKAWEEVSTMLRRGGGDRSAKASTRKDAAQDLAVSGEWRLGGDLGRRYGAVSGDRNPIHIHAWTARPLGFDRAIAHGMWTKARCLAAIESRLPDAFRVEVGFRKPIFLPGRVEFLAGDESSGAIAFAVRDVRRRTPHLDGHLKRVKAKKRSERKKS
ncbi:MAG TPA: MaoC/PaaZ C-terminal domain-containing protein [Solirubrobacterales bacterium]